MTPSAFTPSLGTGIGIRSEFYDDFIKEIPSPIHWGEVITENFLPRTNGIYPDSIRTLEHFRSQIPIALHGVSLSLGSTDPLSKDYLKRYKQLIRRIEPAWISDHLCWTGVGGKNLHALLPLPYHEEAIRVVVEKIKRVQDFLNRRILIENLSSYVEFEASEMTEWEFVSEIVTRSDCGILLDINNVYVSSVNHRFDPMTYLDSIPHDRVGQIHLAGHSVEENHLFDTHDQPICEPVWELYERFLQKHGIYNTMLERDDNFPKWDDLHRELLRIDRIYQNTKAQTKIRYTDLPHEKPKSIPTTV